MKFAKLTYALLSALMIAGASAPTVATFASTNETPVTEPVAVEETSVLSENNTELDDIDLSAAGVTGNDLDQAAQLLQLLFEQGGEISADGHYRVTNLDVLSEYIASTDGDMATAVQEIYDLGVVEEAERADNVYLLCVIGEATGLNAIKAVAAFLTGDAGVSLKAALSNRAWEAAAKMMAKLVVKAGIVAATDTNLAAIIGRTAVAVVSCMF